MKRASLGGELLAEFIGTAILILFGCGVVGTVVLLGEGDWTTITLGWGLGVTLGVYIAGGVSGGHINPAVTLAMALRRGFPKRKVLPYMAVQILGAFFGAALVYLAYSTYFMEYEAANKIVRGGVESLGSGGAGVFATYPLEHITPLLALFIEALGTFLLVTSVFALTDEENLSPKSNLSPLLIGLTVVAIGMSFGGLTGYAINPARDLGPRLLSFAAGWGPNVFTYWWQPIFGPLIGGAIASYVYDFGIKKFLKKEA